MSHEIYYTSAPEGLKRGSSGFCTVAASAEIPKALWDRLETLSAYRHHFETGARAGGGANPVSHAHWILNVTGRTYHVLSRVADAGVDHTQRTNSFAHHLVVERGEMEGAAGGPAWLLQQPGVMAEGWDGRPATLARRTGLPQGERGPRLGDGPRICRAWESFTGDAGWGGHLVDTFIKAPTRPVCVLFSPGQEILPLVAEAIALLPPGARWNVTFNTYFTSMPTSATCLWRFCLAGTPAAEVGLRYAAGGLVLNLAERSSLPIVPAGPYVAVARTGHAIEPAKAEARVAVETTSKEQNGGSSAGNFGKSPKSPSERPEKQPAATVPPPAYSAARVRNAPAMRNPQADSPADDEIPLAPGRIVRGMAIRRGAPSSDADWALRAAEDGREQADRDAEQVAGRRRKQVALLFGGALLAIGVGTGVIYWVHKRAAPSLVPERSQVPAGSENNFAPPEQGGKIASGSPAAPQAGLTAPTQAVERESPPTEARVTESPAIGPVIPGVVTLTTILERPNLGMGIGDSVQTLGVPAGAIALPGSVTALQMRFPVPPARADQEAREPGNRQDFNGGDLGLLIARPETRMGKPGLALRWRASAAGMSEPVEALFIGFDRVRPGLELQWHAAALLKNPGIMSLLYWVLQNSSIELSGAPGVTQQIRFRAFDPSGPTGRLDFAGGPLEVNWPVDLPREVAAVPPVFVPGEGDPAAGPGKWEATWYTDWEVKDAALRSASNASQVIKFKKATGAGVVDAWFLITFRPGLRKMESTFALRKASDEADLARFESELRAINMQIEEAKANNNGVLGNSPGALDLQARRDQTQVLINAYKEAVAGYNELSQFDVAFDLPDGVRLTALHFARPAKAKAGK